MLPRTFLRCALLAAVVAGGGCGESHPLWRDQKLPSGRTVKVTSFHLAWGSEHDERIAANDSFDLEFVYAQPDAGDAAREVEAKEVFELIRPLAERWNLPHASVSGFPTLQRKGKYELYTFERGADGQWKSQRISRKVFVND
jgi:hypothetical protein